MLYTTPFLQFAGTGFFGCTSSCRRVLKGRKLTWIARGANTLLMNSDNPLKYGRVNEARTSRSHGDPRSGCGQVCFQMKLFGYPFFWRAWVTCFSSCEGLTPEAVGTWVNRDTTSKDTGAPEGPSFSKPKGREWCKESLVPNVPAPTSAKQADAWMSASENTAGP